MENKIKKIIMEKHLFESELFLTKLQDLHYNKLLTFFKVKNMVDLQVKFADYILNNFIKDKTKSIEKDYNQYFLSREEEFEEYVKLTYKEYIEFWRKLYDKTGN